MEETMIVMTRQEIKNSIIDYRKETGQRDLKDSSLLQYIQNFSKLQNEIEPDKELNLNFVLDETEVDKKLSSYSLTTRRNYYNCIIIILESNKKNFDVDIDDSIKSYIKKKR